MKRSAALDKLAAELKALARYGASPRRAERQPILSQLPQLGERPTGEAIRDEVDRAIQELTGTYRFSWTKIDKSSSTEREDKTGVSAERLRRALTVMLNEDEAKKAEAPQRHAQAKELVDAFFSERSWTATKQIELMRPLAARLLARANEHEERQAFGGTVELTYYNNEYGLTRVDVARSFVSPRSGRMVLPQHDGEFFSWANFMLCQAEVVKLFGPCSINAPGFHETFGTSEWISRNDKYRPAVALTGLIEGEIVHFGYRVSMESPGSFVPFVKEYALLPYRGAIVRPREVYDNIIIKAVFPPDRQPQHVRAFTDTHTHRLQNTHALNPVAPGEFLIRLRRPTPYLYHGIVY